jgi:hypothetical protein
MRGTAALFTTYPLPTVARFCYRSHRIWSLCQATGEQGKTSLSEGGVSNARARLTRVPPPTPAPSCAVESA